MAEPHKPPEPAPAMVEVADGVHAYLQPDGGWFLNNAALVVGPDGCTSVDTTATEARTRAYQRAIGRVTDRPVRTIVATHHHGDHTHGNHLFPGATVVSHAYCRQRVLADDYYAALALFTGPAWGDIRPLAPHLTFRDTLTLWSGERRIELRHPGRTAHTAGDLYAWLPDDRILVSGDLVFDGGTPLVVEGSASGLARTLEELGELDPVAIVPGHGDLCGLEAVTRTLEYLGWLRELAAAGHAERLTPLETARQADAGRWAALREPERLVANLHSCYAELTGIPVDMRAVAADLLAFHGGPIPCQA